MAIDLILEKLEQKPVADQGAMNPASYPPPAKRRRQTIDNEILVGSLSDGRLRLKSPMLVKFEEENGEFVAEATDFDEFGFGDSRSAALRELQRAMVELYFTLKADKDSLGTDLKSVLSRLEEKIQEHDDKARRI